MTGTIGPRLSVIVPAHQAQRTLGEALAAVCASTLPRGVWELIVVDDASLDETALIAAEFADVVLRLPGRPHGPAYARNRGFEMASGEIIVFVDADVAVHVDTLERFVRIFDAAPTVGAVFGAYDNRPRAPGIVSQYRNLLHHYHHHASPGEAQTFWAGCGAIRASVFSAAGMYDEWAFSRPQIEDIELGNRIHDGGYRILLQPEIQCVHLKVWTFTGMIRTDFRDRGVPWARLLAAQRAPLASGTLNVAAREKLSTVLVWGMILGFGVAAAWSRPDVLYVVAGLFALVIALNLRLYAFFRRTRGAAFTLAVLPLHFLYYTVNGVSAAWGSFLHGLIGDPKPDASVQAFSEVGVKMWPPVPANRSRRWGA
jgi:glycosyltransferase involved in cell wall biosynthesis